MPVQQTPGRWFDYYAATIGPNGPAQTMISVPRNYAFHLDYLLLFSLSPIAAGFLYVGADGVPLLGLGAGEVQKDVVFATKPLIFTQTLIIGTFAALDSIKSFLVSWSGNMVLIAGATPSGVP